MTLSARLNRLIAGVAFATFAVLLCIASPVTAHAQQNASTVTYTSSNIDPDVPRNAHTNAQLALWGTFSGISCLITGNDLLSPTRQCIGPNPMTGKIGYWPRPVDEQGKPVMSGALGSMSSLIAVTYTPPASGVGYVRYMASNFGIDKAQAQSADFAAQGYGATAMAPLLTVFEASRNLAYLLFAFAMVIIGVAIMLRVKIDPRTVMSIQNQIPKIIVGLILITFSFAIVGILVDLMWVTTYISIDTLADAQQNQVSRIEELRRSQGFSDDQIGNPTETERIDIAQSTRNLIDNPIGFSNELLNNGNIINNVSGAIGSTIGEIAASILIAGSKGSTCGLTDTLSGSLEGCFRGLVYSFFGAIAAALAALIIFISLFILLFRIWFMLIRAYAQIVIATIVAPLWITAGLVPGSKLSFGSWFRSTVANLAVFPATVIMFLLAAVVIDAFKISIGTDTEAPGANTLLIPPLVGAVSTASEFGVIVGFGIMLMIPDLLNMLRDALKTPPNQYSGHFRSRLLAGNPMSAVGGLASFGTSMYYMKNAPIIGGAMNKIAEWNLGTQKKAEDKPPVSGR